MTGQDVNFGVRLEADAGQFVGGVKKGADAVEDFGRQTTKSNEEALKGFQRLDAAVGKRLNQLKLEQDAGRKLTEGERLHLDTISSVASGELKLNEAQARSIRSKIDSIKATEAQIAAQSAAQKQAAELARTEAAQLEDRRRRWAAFGVTVGTIIATAAIAATVGLKGAVAAIDDLDERAQAIGTTATELANLRQGALEAGVAAGRFDVAMDQLSRRLIDAQRGGKESVALFQALGFQVNTVAFRNLALRDGIGQIADKFQSFRDGPEKATLALELFGRSGTKTIAWLNQGSEGLSRFSGLTEETVRQAARLQSSLDQLTVAWEQMKNSILGGVLPTLTKTVEEFNAAYRATGSVFGAIIQLSKYSAETLADPARKIAEITAELEKQRQIIANDRTRSGVGASSARAEAKELEAELALLREIQRNRALANGVDDSNERRRRFGGADKPRAPVLPPIGKPPVDELAEAQKAALDEYAARLKEQEQLRATLYQITATALEQQRRETTAMEEANQQLRDHNDEIGLSAAQLADLRDARLAATIAQKEEALATAEAVGGQEAAIAVMRKEIDLLRERRSLLRTGAVREAAAEATRVAVEENKRMAADIERELTGALMRGFESGKTFAQNLRDTLWNLFQTLVLRPIISPIVQQGAGQLAGLGSAIGQWIAGLSGPSQADYSQLGVGLWQPASNTARAPTTAARSEAGATAFRSARSMPAAGGMQSAAGGIKINVIDQAGVQVEAGKARTSPDGGLSMDLIIKRAATLLAGDISRGRGDLGRAIEQTYGLSRKPA